MAPSIKKYRSHFLELYWNFQKKKCGITSEEKNSYTQELKNLQHTILEKDLEGCKKNTKNILLLENKLFPRAKYYRWCKKIFSNAAFIIMIVVLRQTWFEPFQIPTGSMRPTLKELDRLFVTKNQFGINVPLSLGHFYFNDADLKRGSIVTFTGEGMDIDGVEMKYFYLFDGYKQYVKRLCGKPGDVLYFYGGKIYGIDKDDNDISSLLQQGPFTELEHIPFIRLDGKIRSIKNSLYIYQNNIPLARLDRTNWGGFQPKIIYTNDGSVARNYSQLFGMENFGMCQIEKIGEEYFLKISHHPKMQLISLSSKKILPHLQTHTSMLKLDEEMLKTLFNSLQTSRFVVKNSIVFPYSAEEEGFENKSIRPVLRNIADGTYEFFNGIAYKVGFQGHTTALNATHPLMQFDVDRTVKLFNYGIEFDSRFLDDQFKGLMPSRYIYFKDGDLFVMGKKLLDHRDFRLKDFVESEKKKRIENTSYEPFEDKGAPLLKDKTLNKELIKNYGLKIPEGKYYMLGDNHAVSADSRDFGFVPQENLRGSPSYIVTPRIQSLDKVDYPWFTKSKAIVYSIIASAWGVTKYLTRSRRRFPVTFD